MANDFYNHGSFPTTGSAATSASMRAELDSIAAGFDKLPGLTGNGNEVVVVNSSATALTSVATLPAGSGGTGIASYTVGDLVYADTTTSLAKLADVATGNVLISGGVGVAPSYGKVGLTTHVSGVLPTANGGTNLSSFSANQLFYASSTSAIGQSANLTFDGTTLTAANFADSSLTSGRVVYAGASGNLTDSSNMTFNGTTLTVTDFADSSLTSGRVPYATTGGNLTDSSNLTFNGTTLTAAGFSGPLDGTVGAGTPNSGSFTTLTTSSTVTINGGTANQVQYLNGSKALVGSSNMTFDGTTLTAAGFSGPLNGTVGAGTPNTGSFTTLTTSSTVTINGGSANQVQYLNASKVLVGSSNMTFDGTRLTVSDFADTSLTSTRVVFAGTGGALSDAAGLTWDGTNLTATQLRGSNLTSGRVTFAGASGLLSDSANLTWNGTTLGITGALTASADSSFTSTGALLISKGTTGQQPGSPATGMMRYNTTTNQFEGYSGSSPAWKSIGGSALSNDTSTTSNLYPVFAGATSGTAENLFTSNAKLLYKPSTGELSASVPRADNGIFVNKATVSTSYTVATGDNAMSAGVITIANGVTVTVSDGSRWTVI
jgi:hypothetical protein